MKKAAIWGSSAFTVILCLFLYPLKAQEKITTSQVNIFKNGYYYIQKEGTIEVSGKKALIMLPDKPLLGCFWLWSNKEMPINNTLFKKDTLKINQKIDNYAILLKNNINKKVALVYKHQEVREIKGTLMGLMQHNSIVKIKTNEGKYVFLDINAIIELSFEDAPVEMASTDSIAKFAQIVFEKNGKSADIKLAYMQHGIQWIPSYVVKILNQKELNIEMKSIIENFSEPVIDAEVILTVGNPNFYYGNTIDPVGYLYLTELRNSSLYTKPVGTYQTLQVQSNVYDSRALLNEFDESDNSFTTNFDTEGEKTNDLYMYKLGKQTLPKNSKIALPIFSSVVTYKDLFEVKIPDFLNYSYNSFANSYDPEKRYDVFHSLKITNSTNYPFTTAPVLVLNEQQQPLAQDQLKYTPVGGHVLVQLSKAGDVIVKNVEEEIKIVENAKQIGKKKYNKVTVSGVIEINNLLSNKISLNIEKNITALVNSMSDGGKATKSGVYSNVNPVSRVEWEINMEAKEKKKITYEYDVFVTNN